MYASSGNAEMASDSFAKALHYAEQDPDPYAYTSILHSHAMSASMLGRTELAATLFLQALSAARDRNLGWNVACISREYSAAGATGIWPMPTLTKRQRLRILRRSYSKLWQKSGYRSP
jgi:hypothetical protein